MFLVTSEKCFNVIQITDMNVLETSLDIYKMKLCGIFSRFFPGWTWFTHLDCLKPLDSRVLQPPVFDLGGEDVMWEFVDGEDRGVAGEGALSLVTS